MYFAQVFPTVGALQKTTTWDAHLSARYQFKYDIGAAVNYSAPERLAVCARSSPRTLPNAGNVAFFDDDLTNARNENIHLLAFRVDKSFTVDRVKITGMFDLFNALNTNAVTNFNLVNGIEVQPDQRDRRSADGAGRDSPLVLIFGPRPV